MLVLLLVLLLLFDDPSVWLKFGREIYGEWLLVVVVVVGGVVVVVVGPNSEGCSSLQRWKKNSCILSKKTEKKKVKLA